MINESTMKQRLSTSRTRASMQHGYRELLSAHMVRFTVAMNAAIVVVMVLAGPAGTFYSCLTRRN